VAGHRLHPASGATGTPSADIASALIGAVPIP